MVTQNNIQLNRDKKICHGLGCFNNATSSIQEDGYDGILLLCDDCIAKFPKEITGGSDIQDMISFLDRDISSES